MAFIRLPDYEQHRAMHAADQRRVERRIAHHRGLREQRSATTRARGDGSRARDRVLSALSRWFRRIRVARPAPRADGPPSHTQLLTDAVCRLADGTRGRIAIVRESDDEWRAVCVRVE